jgi:Ca2+-binding RTX toxin-like protein
MIDLLESRRLLTATLAANGTLTVLSTNTADTITTSIVGAQFRVVENGATQNFSAAKVTKVLIKGMAGNDTITHGASRPSTILGGEGNDDLTGGPGKDSIDGQNKNDTVDGGAGADTLKGGTGEDTVDYSGRAAAVTVTLNNAAGDGVADEKDNVFNTVENVLGGAGDDVITGSPFNNRLVGGNGNDSLSGGGGADLLEGGDGADTLKGGDGNDLLAGETSDVFDAGGDVDVMDGGAGFDFGNKGDEDTHTNLEGIFAPGPLD